MNGAVIGTGLLTDFDYVDDVALLVELISLLQSTLEIFSQEAIHTVFKCTGQKARCSHRVTSFLSPHD